MTASIDFLEEVGRQASLTFRVDRILHIEGEDGPDLAFLQVVPADGQALAVPIGLSTTADVDDMVAVIGYAARDSRIPDQLLMDRIFDQVYDKKRLAPGQLTQVARESILHDCSTLGGNSGSVVLSLRSGQAVGLHFAGRFLQANFAVPSTLVAERLEQAARGGTPRPPQSADDRRERPDRREPATRQAQADFSGREKVSYVFPVRVTVEVGDPYPDSDRAADYPSGKRGAAAGDDEVFTEAVPADYRDRQGYREDFLGDGAVLLLPKIKGNKATSSRSASEIPWKASSGTSTSPW